MIYLKYDVEPVAIAVLTSPRPRDEARSYVSDHYETRLIYEYKNIDVRELDDERLLSSDNRVPGCVNPLRRETGARKSK